MKKTIKKAQMGGSYAQRRAYKSAGAGKPSPSFSPSPEKNSKTRTTKAPAEGSDISKYTRNNKSDLIKMASERSSVINAPGVKYTSVVAGPVYKGKTPVKPNAAQQKSADEYYRKLASGPKKTTAPKAATSSESKRKPVRTAAVAVTAKRDITKQGAPSKPSVPGIQKGPVKRKYSDSQIKIMKIMQKGKQADGTMSESAQRKIQAVRAKERASNKKALRKSARASKFNARKIKKSGK